VSDLASYCRPLTSLDFYARDPISVARDLLGMVLVRRSRAGLAAGRIVETEAYLHEADPASHSYRGRTPRNASMFGPPGRSYVYTIHARFCFNVVTDRRNIATAVLVRALEPLAGQQLMHQRRKVAKPSLLTRGPARLCEALAIDRRLDGWNLTRGARLWIAKSDEVEPLREITVSPRIGVTSGEDLPLRFCLAGSPYLSR
jgi:DNA-3-methyladenine glycosylase